MLDIANNAKYAPTAATAGLLCFHHHTAVVPNQTPEMVKSTVKLAMNA